jgi:hypothetical protein
MLKLLVGGEDVMAATDGLHGEPYSDDGWYARFSEFGEPPEEA